MTRTLSARLAFGVAAALITMIGTATQAIADGPPAAPNQVVDFPAGIACAGFDLRVEIWSNTNRVFKEFKDKNGNVVRTLSAGKGDTLAFTNLATSQRLMLKANGSVLHSVVNPDGSQTVAVTGHFVLIFFPTDVPAGPSTTQYVGRVVYIDNNGMFTLQSVSGTSLNICAAVA